MNDWPPPSVPDAPLGAASSPAERAAPWWRRRRAGVATWGWATIGLIAVGAFAVIGNALAPGGDGVATGDPRPLTTTVDVTTAEPTTASTTAPTTTPSTTPSTTTASTPTPSTTAAPTTVPRVQSAPPTPPTTEAAPVPTTDPGPTTTIVVTLPPTTTLPAAPAIEIDLRFDADGDDNVNRNDEWVRFTNAGAQSVDVTNWIVRDDGLVHAHVFDALVLEPGAAVTVRSGCGEPTATERYFCTSGSEVWNNDGDVVSLFDAAGDLVARRIG